MLRTLIIPAVVCSLCSSIVQAQVTLKPKYEEGTKTVTHRDSKTSQTLTLAGMDIDTKATTFVVSGRTIGKRGPDGVLKIEEKATTLQSEVVFPGGMIQFDSSNPDKKADLPQLEPILEIFRTVYRLPLIITLDGDNKITEVKLPEGEFEKLSEDAQKQFNSENLKKTAEQAQSYLPDDSVKKGDSWERSTEANLGGGQVLSFRTKYEYEGTVEQEGVKLDKITGKAIDVNFAINGNPMLQVTNSELKIVDSEISYLFNRELGATISQSSKTRIAGPLTLVINGSELPGKVDLTIEEKTTREK